MGIEGRIHPRRSVRIEQPRDQGEGEEEVEAEVEGEPGNRTEDLQGHIPEGRVLALEEALAWGRGRGLAESKQVEGCYSSFPYKLARRPEGMELGTFEVQG